MEAVERFLEFTPENLLARFDEQLRLRHFSRRTISNYTGSVHRYLAGLGRAQVRTISTKSKRIFLTER